MTRILAIIFLSGLSIVAWGQPKYKVESAWKYTGVYERHQWRGLWKADGLMRASDDDDFDIDFLQEERNWTNAYSDSINEDAEVSDAWCYGGASIVTGVSQHNLNVTLGVEGEATAWARFGRADATSRSRTSVELGIDGPKGSVKWTPQAEVSATPTGKDRRAQSKIVDPLSLRVFDATLQEALVVDMQSMTIDVADGGDVFWKNGVLAVQAKGSGRIDLSLGNAYTDIRGGMTFAFMNGVVTESVSTGVFAGMLPGVGQSSGLNLWTGDFELKFDFSPFSTNDLEYGMDVFQEGFAEEAVPEPATLAGLVSGLAFLAHRRSRRCSE